MVFSSYLFLFLFLPAVLAIYYLFPRKLKNLILFIFSYTFYAWGAPSIILILFLSSLCDYFLSKAIYGSLWGKRKSFLALAITINLGLLFYYKYANFFVTEANAFLSFLGFSSVAWTAIALPIGISFFTFQKISYLVDVYRKKVSPATNFINYALYVALFPQLIAGPIIRYHDVAEQIEERQHKVDNFFYGMYRFALGLGKKVLIADPLGLVADNVFALSPETLTTSYAWVGILCYTFQIYFDFSGYSDMAIGLGRMFGFRFLENFNMPYISQNFTEFWRRWHISLSNWMKEYLYIPLGGNRLSALRTYMNLWIVFLLSGLWHGASWSFIVWGAYHGAFLAFDKLYWLERSKNLSKHVKIALTFFFVIIGWVFFRAETLSQAIHYLQTMFGLQGLETATFARASIIHNRAIAMLALGIALSFIPAFSLYERIKTAISSQTREYQVVVFQGATAIVCLFLSTCALAAVSYTPFLYFKF